MTSRYRGTIIRSRFRISACALFAVVLLPLTTANAYWFGRSETKSSGQSVVRASAGDQVFLAIFECDAGRLSFTLQAAAASAPATVELTISIDGGAADQYKIAASSFVGTSLTISVSEEDAIRLAGRAVRATGKFAASVVLDAGKTKFETNQSMTGGPKAIGAVIEACRR